MLFPILTKPVLSNLFRINKDSMKRFLITALACFSVTTPAHANMILHCVGTDIENTNIPAPQNFVLPDDLSWFGDKDNKLTHDANNIVRVYQSAPKKPNMVSEYIEFSVISLKVMTSIIRTNDPGSVPEYTKNYVCEVIQNPLYKEKIQ